LIFGAYYIEIILIQRGKIYKTGILMEIKIMENSPLEFRLIILRRTVRETWAFSSTFPLGLGNRRNFISG